MRRLGWVGTLEIKGLDGEKKALVYDNYSKLIAATDTIRKVGSHPRVGIFMGQREATAFLTERFYVDALQYGSTDANHFDTLSRNLTYRRNGDVVICLVPGPRLDGRRSGGVERRSGHSLGEKAAATGDRTVGLQSPTTLADDARCG